MAKATLPTNYQDDILNVSTEGKRKYRMNYNDDGTVSFVDVTPYDQEGSDYGAGDINATNEAVNQSADAGKIIDDPDTAEATTEEGYIAGVQLFNHVNDSLQSIAEWKSIEINKKFTTTSGYVTLGTFEELINASEYVVVIGASSVYANKLSANSDGIINFMYVSPTSFVSWEYGYYIATVRCKLDVNSGLLEGEQISKGESANYSTVTRILYR